MADKGDIGLLAAAIGAGILLRQRGGGSTDDGTEEPPSEPPDDGQQDMTCAEVIQAAQSYATGESGCDGTDVILDCPHGDVSYQVQNTCEEDYLRARDWTAKDMREKPDFKEYTLTVWSDDPTGVDYTLHLGPQPSGVTSGISSRRFAEPGSDEQIVRQTDGTWIVRGSIGSGDGTEYGDTFRWTTTDDYWYGMLGWEASTGTDAYRLELNGEEFDPNQLPTLSV